MLNAARCFLLVVAITTGAGLNVSQASDRDPSMLILAGVDARLISKKIALSLTRQLIEKVYGADELKIQEPLTVLDSGESWTIQGSRKFGEKPPRSNNLPDYGKVELIVSKADCQILKFTREFTLSPPGDHH